MRANRTNGRRKESGTKETKPFRRFRFVVLNTVVVLFAGLVLASAAEEKSSKSPQTLKELLALPPEQLDKVDIAVMNLLCAEGLRGAEKMDVPQLLKTLDSWARWVGFNTQRHYYRFQKDPGYFKNSEGDFRMAFLSATLQQQYGVRYDPERAGPQLRDGPYAEPGEIFFADSKDIFIHGLLDGRHYGTCSSMPVLFAAVGRRLGYPVHLATSKTHIWVRYHEGDGHFNVEATSPGYSVYPDAYYQEKYVPVTDEEVKTDRYLQALDGKETLALFLSLRFSCCMAANQLEKAREAAAMAYKLAPHVKEHKIRLDHIEAEIEGSRKAAKWNELVKEIPKLVPPPGEKFEYYRDRKIDLQMYLITTADVDGFEKGWATLKQELVAETKKDEPTRLNISLEKSQPPVPIQIVVLPEKARYITVDGQTIETLVKSPEQLESFFREQRIFDKVAVIHQRSLAAAGQPPAPWQALRPTSLQTKLGVPRNIQLQIEEEKLDAYLKDTEDEPPLSQIMEPNTQALPGLLSEAQGNLGLINSINAFNKGQNRGVPNYPSPLKEQLELLEQLKNPLRVQNRNPLQ